jgi:hypothetical protein
MMRTLLLLAVLSSPIAGQATPYPYTLSGDRFVDMMSRPEPLSTNDYMEREKAYSYLNGARDSAEGRVWCDINQLKTPDMAYELAGEIAKLPTAERKKNASLLLLGILKLKYPCRSGGAS